VSETIRLRIRQIKPEFFADEEMALLDMAYKALYVGLWQCADDAGFLPWRPEEIAYHLRLNGLGPQFVRDGLDAINRLPGTRRIVVERCRRHLRLVHLKEHQHYATSTHNVVRHQTEHRRECLGEDVAGPGTRPKAALEGNPAEAPPKPAQAPLRVGVGVGDGDGEGEGEPAPPPEVLPTYDGNLYHLYRALTGKPPDARHEKWIDDTVHDAGSLDAVRDLMLRWVAEGKGRDLLGWVTYQLREQAT